jgi:hypothetical protein
MEERVFKVDEYRDHLRELKIIDRPS